MLPGGKPHQMLTIAVAEKIIADISTGIYRTPAAALKELVTNAYDADATEVEITTGAPTFEVLTIKDNGTGIDLSRFLEIMQHIGGSWKRLSNPDGLSPIHKRPVIGRIGIGLLAVAQLGQRFYVSSTRKGSPTRFLAEVDLTPFHRDDAALRKLTPSSHGESDTVEIGTVKYVDGLPEPEETHFTVVTVPDPKRGLISEMHGQLRNAIGAEAAFDVDNRASDFRALVETVRNKKRAEAVLDGYHYLLWELGLLAPVKYLDGGIFKKDSKRRPTDADKVLLQEPKEFKVFVDGYDIRRPILFPNSSAETYGGPPPIAYPFRHSGKVAGRELSFYGYIYSQKPHIDPVELQGLQIRIRGAGIGGFDRTWMGYPFDEGIKFGQLTGEIFIEEGLESALNIDRASFRETDPHYLALRAWVWNLLKTKVFPDFKSRQARHLKEKRATAQTEQEKRLAAALAEAPEVVGVKPRVQERPQSSAPPTRPARGSKGILLSKTVGARQSIVSIVEGEAVVSKSAFAQVVAQYGLPDVAQSRLLRVCAALAGFGVWEDLNDNDAQKLLNALAVAVA